MLNVVNSQRGEHPLFETSVYARLIHNKTELIHPFIFNVDKLLSPAAIFASGFWHYVSPYYPLGFLFPWDIYFIFRYLRFRTNNTKKKSGIFFVPVLILLFVLTGILYIDQAVTFSFAVLYFLALLAAKGYLTTSSKTRIVFTLINFVYLLYHLSTINYFKI
ncbi:MAG: hypothetical protein ACD_58C00130G0001 [uncultured bacterium]|nr:MAG: hypothetical protein ACD_58C00130G0001 [uncultured bacterium]